ncbi:dihydrofolate reductase family protein [Nocardioides mesophilus]|uniref:Dihydrofolate reductase family protein n=1 Tax=Nocardioides mesophilus TaxID=433659 RepID=A0A7G9RFG6_9ACTN|nr:dihydrofolate reductase family protein [Nocardioides mesophilus]QNN54341.1 dihydrofolate reductase family protein [Nocardioides mesophilus]
MGSKVVAGITTSVDGYYAGPDDGPGRGLGIGGERLHYWVFGGPWTYEGQRDAGDATGEDREFLEHWVDANGAVICGRGTYDAAGAWGGRNPWPVPLFVLTHRVEEQPAADTGFVFVADLGTAVRRAREAAGDKGVFIMGGGGVITEALAAGLLDELVVSVSPVILGRGKRLFDGFDRDVDLRKLQVWSSPLATHVRYAVRGG